MVRERAREPVDEGGGKEMVTAELKVVDVTPVDAVGTFEVIDGAERGSRGGDRCEGFVPVFFQSRPYVEVAVVIAADDYLVGMGQSL